MRNFYFKSVIEIIFTQLFYADDWFLFTTDDRTDELFASSVYVRLFLFVN